MGHGHVKPNADGSKARCGGPAICSECALELAATDVKKVGIMDLLENSPPEVKAMASKHNLALQRVWRAEKQIKLWTKEKEIADLAAHATETDWIATLNRYEGDKFKSDEKLEL